MSSLRSATRSSSEAPRHRDGGDDSAALSVAGPRDATRGGGNATEGDREGDREDDRSIAGKGPRDSLAPENPGWGSALPIPRGRERPLPATRQRLGWLGPVIVVVGAAVAGL